MMLILVHDDSCWAKGYTENIKVARDGEMYRRLTQIGVAGSPSAASNLPWTTRRSSVEALPAMQYNTGFP